MQLEVEEDGQAEAGEGLNAGGAVGGEIFEAELEPADLADDLPGDSLRLLRIGRVEGDEDRVGHISCGSSGSTLAGGLRTIVAGALATWTAVWPSSRRFSDQIRA